jgi:hypothetical protein
MILFESTGTAKKKVLPQGRRTVPENDDDDDDDDDDDPVSCEARLFSTPMTPPLSSMMRLQIERPIVPPPLMGSEKGLKSSSLSSSAIPGPESTMSKRINL